MTYRSGWYLRDHVFWHEITDALGLEDLQGIKRDADMLVVTYPGQYLHSLVDTRTMKGLQVGIKDMVTTFSQFEKDRLTGWVIIIGEINPLLRFIISVLSQTFRFKFRIFATLEEALSFLHDQDALVPPQPLDTTHLQGLGLL